MMQAMKHKKANDIRAVKVITTCIRSSPMMLSLSDPLAQTSAGVNLGVRVVSHKVNAMMPTRRTVSADIIVGVEHIQAWRSGSFRPDKAKHPWQSDERAP
ncbi:dystrophin [Biomphalaria glabrata]